MPSGAVIYNHDVGGVISRLDRIQVEVQKCVSSTVSEYNQFDIVRLRTFTANLRGFIAWVDDEPQLDLPESHPREIQLPSEPEINQTENEEVNMLASLISLARYEMVNSQSSRKPCGLVSFDRIRFLAVVTKIENFLDNYIVPLTPLDLPESSPQAEMVAPGRTGTGK